MSDDAAVGVKSSALAFATNLKQAVGAAYGLAILLLSLGLYIQIGIGIWLAGLSLMALHLADQLRRIDRDDKMGALRLFRSNRNAGLILVGALVLTRALG
jgi:4-hydroxybenzoate polyprenyltransferase